MAGEPNEHLLVPRKTWPTFGTQVEQALAREGIEDDMARKIGRAFGGILSQWTQDEVANYRALESWANTHTHLGGVGGGAGIGGGAWAPLTAIPGSMNAVRAVALSATGVIHAIAGTTHRAYDIATDTWSLKAAPPVSFTAPAMAVLSDGIHVAAGGTTAHYRYDPVANTWSGPLTAAPGMSNYSEGLEHEGRFYVLEDGNLYYYDIGGLWTTAAPMIERIEGPAFGKIGPLFYAAGNSGVTGLGHCEVYDAAANTWTVLTPPTDSFASDIMGGVVEGRLYVVGAPNGTFAEYDPSTDTWDETLPPYPSGSTAQRRGADAVHNGRLYVFGGQPGGADAYSFG